jgi:hypothetical protein
MDPTSTALSASWLNAVNRIQSQGPRDVAQDAPDSQPAQPQRTLTDVIEHALITAGAGAQPADGWGSQWGRPGAPTAALPATAAFGRGSFIVRQVLTFR